MLPISLVEATTAELATAVAAGLGTTPRRLNSRFFYDDTGSALFRQIMALPEYYPTRAELSLFQAHSAALVEALAPHDSAPFHLVELGAGDGLKTRVLLQALLSAGATFEYAPIDISGAALDGLAAALAAELPNLVVKPVVAEYYEGLRTLRQRPGRKAVLFLGSNIGNFDEVGRQAFLRGLAAHLTPADRLLVGFDLRKNPRRIHAAYDDAAGVTAAFNLNLLRRLNRELGADFDLNAWQHFASYDPQAGAMRAWLVSRCAQTVHIAALSSAFEFAAWEAIHTEDSYKFTLPQITAEAARAGLQVVTTLVHEEAEEDFADVVLTVV